MSAHQIKQRVAEGLRPLVLAPVDIDVEADADVSTGAISVPAEDGSGSESGSGSGTVSESGRRRSTGTGTGTGGSFRVECWPVGVISLMQGCWAMDAQNRPVFDAVLRQVQELECAF